MERGGKKLNQDLDCLWYLGQQSFQPEVKKIESLKSLQIPHNEQFLVLPEFTCANSA